MSKASKLTLLGAIAFSLSACLDTDGERAVAGAAAGAATSSVVGGDVATGAIIGAAAGALCDDVNICN